MTGRSPFYRARVNHEPIHVRRDRGAPREALTAMLGDDLAWVDDRALCAQVDAELFHPEKGGTTVPAKAVCAGCDLIEQCLQYALVARPTGVWGGTGAEERKRMRPRRAA